MPPKPPKTTGKPVAASDKEVWECLWIISKGLSMALENRVELRAKMKTMNFGFDTKCMILEFQAAASKSIAVADIASCNGCSCPNCPTCN